MTANENLEERYTSKLVLDERLYEEIYNPETNEANFVYYDDQTDAIQQVPYIDEGNVRYLPLIDNFVRIEAVLLPTEAKLYETEEKLLNDIQNHIHTYLDISVEDEQISTWTIPTYWLYDKLHIMIPYLRAFGDTGCGKSRFLDVLGGLSYKPMMVGGSVTPAILYRVTEKWKGTMIIDEADWKHTDEYSEVIKIINCNQPNRRILRCRGDNYDEIEAFNPWCPRIFATRRQFYDMAAESRMLTIKMRETSRNDIPIVLDDEFRTQQEHLRNQLLTYRLKNWNRVGPQIKPDLDLTGVEPRTQQIMYPIAITFNHNKDILKQLTQMMKGRETELVKERSSTLDGVIINIYFELLNEGYECITASDIAARVQEKGYSKATPYSVGHTLKSLGVTNTVTTLKGKSIRCYSCDDELLEKLRKRYSLNNLSQQEENDEKLQKLQRLQRYRVWGRLKKGIKNINKKRK